VTLRLARIKPAVRELLARDGVLDRIGGDQTYDEVDHAVAAQMAAQGGSRADL
jgi:sulfate permease, SulP family